MDASEPMIDYSRLTPGQRQDLANNVRSAKAAQLLLLAFLSEAPHYWPAASLFTFPRLVPEA